LARERRNLSFAILDDASSLSVESASASDLAARENCSLSSDVHHPHPGSSGSASSTGRCAGQITSTPSVSNPPKRVTDSDGGDART
jgi:hypothetical protein